MSSRPLRFVQAGDFQLHQPLSGLMEVPDHLAPRLIEAPYQAAERVFDAALAAEVDFVLLTGNLCDPHRAGPRGLVFLAGQFARLAERGIAIYWATGGTDGRRDWPTQIKWPEGVHIFAPNRVEHLTHHRSGKPICQIAGRSVDGLSTATELPAAAFAPNPDGLFSIAILPSPFPFEADDLSAVGNHYWACGGSRSATTTLAEFDPQCVVHCAGTPQGRSPQEIGPRGCTMVHVDAGENLKDHDQIRLTSIETDVVRWHDEQIVLSSPAEQAELENRLHERMQTLIAAAGRSSGICENSVVPSSGICENSVVPSSGICENSVVPSSGIRETSVGPGSGICENSVLLIRWHIDQSNLAVGSLNQSGPTAELLCTLRTEYGFRETPAWSVSLTIEPPVLPASWSEQQTLLGEFLRGLRELESPNAEGPGLDCFLSQRQLASALAQRVSLTDPKSRVNVLRQAAILGAELLSSGTVQRDAAAHGDSSLAKGAISR